MVALAPPSRTARQFLLYYSKESMQATDLVTVCRKHGNTSVEDGDRNTPLCSFNFESIHFYRITRRAISVLSRELTNSLFFE